MSDEQQAHLGVVVESVTWRRSEGRKSALTAAQLAAILCGPDSEHATRLPTSRAPRRKQGARGNATEEKREPGA